MLFWNDAVISNVGADGAGVSAGRGGGAASARANWGATVGTARLRSSEMPTRIPIAIRRSGITP